MNFRRHFRFAAIAIAVLAFAQLAQAQTAGDGKIANMSVGASGVRWDMLVPNSGGTVTISFPDGRSVKKAFKAGGSAEFDLSDRQLESLPDGVYNYDLRLAPALTAAQKETIMKARGDDDEPDALRNLRKRPAVASLNQSGSFAIVNGALIGPGLIEGERTGAIPSQQQPKAPAVTPARVSANTVTRLRNHRFSLGVRPDDVIADDLIVQGSACVGLDCVNGEVFNFDTIRMKENNTRISFTDTSTSAGFPTEDWTIRANASGSGGGNFLAFVDRGSSSTGDESGTIVFEVDAGAPANALRVSSAGKIGIRTATPVLDVHVTSTDTPAIRQEQTNGGGFTAQTWDIGANEANWFVRDVTGGSRLPFRIRPGAPTSSIDISATGLVGIGTASPGVKVEIKSTNGGPASSGTVQTNGGWMMNPTGDVTLSAGVNSSQNYGWLQAGDIRNLSSNYVVAINPNGGNVGIGTSSPDQRLSVNGDADKVGGGSWLSFSDERLKKINGSYTSGLKAVMQLSPVRYEYLKNNALGLKSDGEHVGFRAQAVEKVIPEAVVKNANGYLMVNNDPIIWTMLNAIKEQQKEIESLKSQVAKLKAPRHRRQRK